MVNINLLPWRQQQRAKARRAYLMTCLLTVIILLCAVLLWRLYLQNGARHLLLEQQAINLAGSTLSQQQQEVNRQAHLKQYKMKAIAISSTDHQRLRIIAHLLTRVSEALPEGAILRLLELSDQTVKLKVIIKDDYLKPSLFAALLHLPELSLLQVQQVQRLKDSSNYELALFGTLASIKSAIMRETPPLTLQAMHGEAKVITLKQSGQ